MKVHTVIRLLDKNRLGPWNHWNSDCKVEGHRTSADCNCQVPKHWVFPYDVHTTYQELIKRYYY